ncbi:MAG: hypothetical protein JNG83_04730 [Opitutaceae bacterium]|nr:hypothetical protein [Opitutaceae bacterium]
MAPTWHNDRGAFTLVALCFTAIIGIALASYLSICLQSLQTSTRTVQRGQAYSLAETGLEEALVALNESSWTGWSLSGSTMSRTFTDYALGAGGTGQVAVSVANYSGNFPTLTAAATLSYPNGRSLTRTLRATTTVAPVFVNAVASASNYVYFPNGGVIDSWNSDPDNNPATAVVAYSFTAGNTSNYAAIVSGNYNSTYGVYLNKATVYGYVNSPDKPITWTSGVGKVKGPTTPAGTDVDTSRVGKSSFVPMFDIVTPTGAASYYLDDSNDHSTYGTGASTPVILDAYDLYISSGETLTINGPVIIRVSHNLNVYGTGKILVTANGSLQLFVANDLDISSSGGLQNNTNEPKKLAVFSTDSSTSNYITYSSSADFRGVIYSKNRPIYVTSNAEFYGAFLSDQWVYFSGSSFKIHYDLALRNARFSGVDTPYLINQLTEL